MLPCSLGSAIKKKSTIVAAWATVKTLTSPVPSIGKIPLHFFFSVAFVTCVRYHGNRNGHSTSLGKRQKEDDGVIKNENQAIQ